MRRPSFGPRWWLACAAAVILVAATGFVAAAGRMAPAGLSASVAADGNPRVIETLDSGLSSRSIEQFRAELGPQRMTVKWRGYLIVPESRVYRFEIMAPGRVRLWIGQDLIVDRTGERHPVVARGRVSLQPGLHRVLLENDRGSAGSTFQIRWRDDNPHRAETLPAEAFVARRPPDWLLAARPLVQPLGLAVASVWSVLLVAGLGVVVALVVRRIAPGAETLTTGRDATAVVILLAVVLFVVGIGWGLPGEGWAPDELMPGDVLAHGFSDAWPAKYPPFHFWLLSLVYAPVLALASTGAFDAWSLEAATTMTLLGRLLSLAMGIGTVMFAALLASRLFGRRAAAGAALATATFLPFVYHAKMANLDAPYVFWFTLSLVFWDALRRDGRTSQYAAFGVAAAFAVGTKDQAYGLYGLTALFVIWNAVRRERRAGLLKVAAAGLAAGVSFVVLHNLLLDIDGFRDHLAALTGPASTHYRMFPPTAAGQWHLGRVTLGQLLAGPGVAGILLAGTGVGVALGRVGRPGIWLFVPVVSYLLTFTAVVGYQYDRFLMPVFVIFAVFAGPGLVWWCARGRAGQAVAAVSVIALCVRAASVDLLLLGDSRHAVEAWLEARVEPRQTVGSFGKRLYLPRLSRYRHWELNGSRGQTEALDPDFVVVNTDHMRRYDANSPEHAWLDWLNSGNEYRESFRFRTTAGLVGLRWLHAFRDGDETPFTNLDKAGAEFVVYERRN